MEVEEIFSYTLTDIKDLDQLMHELSSNSFCDETILDAIINDENSHAYVLREDNHIVAAGTLCIVHTLEFTNAVIESVVVSSKNRGQGLGRRLVEHMINESRRKNVHSIHLTSNPKRVAANILYQKMGFMKYETNCYVFNINCC